MVCLLVTDGPKFRHRPATVQADQDASVTLTCDVDGNPAPEITWIHEEKDRVSAGEEDMEEAEQCCQATPPAFLFFSFKISSFGDFCLYFPLAFVKGIETRQLKISLYGEKLKFSARVVP